MPIPEKLLRQLYLLDQNSMSDIATELECSIHKVEYWLEKYGITRRNQSDANYIKYNPDGDPFHIKQKLTLEDHKLYSLAVGLFWGEGNKRFLSGVKLCNSDTQVISLWCSFLRKICGVREDKIHFHLQTFKDNNIAVAKVYWSNKLNVSPNRIRTSQPIPSQGKGTYKRISVYGVMSVDVYNTHFRTWMMEQLKKLGYNPD